MPRMKKDYSPEACERWLKQGYGRGANELYKPWINIRNFPSHGRSSAIRGLTVPRIHELFSDLEKMAFTLADFSLDVIDIREQFPLLPLNHIQALSRQVGITYPKVSGHPWVMTTDLLLTLKSNRYRAIAIKPSSELLVKSVRDKLELERLWWASLGVDWVLATEKNLPVTVTENLIYISSFLRGDDGLFHKIEINLLLEISSLLEPRRYLLKEFINLVAKEISCDPEEARNIIFKSIWVHALQIDLTTSIAQSGVISVMKWNHPEEKSENSKNAFTKKFSY